ncbi:MAG: GNAT family N-acetyltransferase [Candidatus Thorarchaeota archaeon]
MTSWEYQSKDGRQITVRTAIRDDAPDFHSGFKEVVEEHMWFPTFTPNSHVTDWTHWIERTNQNREVLLVAHIEGEYAGHLSLQPEEWQASQHVAKLGVIVRKECRGVGVGKALMLSGHSIASKKAYTKIILSTFANNKIAIQLYESLGYRKVGIRKNHFNMPKGFIDEVLMEYKLSL